MSVKMYSCIAKCFFLGTTAAFFSMCTPKSDTTMPLKNEALIEVISLGTKTDFRFKGLALNAKDSMAYLGSWDRKEIVAVSLADGKAAVLSSSYSKRLNGMGCFFQNGILYAVMNEVDDNPDARPLSVLVMFDVSKHEAIRSYEAKGAGGRNHFNHVVVDDSGIAYISNTLKSSIWSVDTTNPLDSLKLLVQHVDLSWVHGIDLSPDQTILYATSYKAGIRFLHLSDLKFSAFRDTTTAGDDGIKYYAGYLYGVGHNAIKRYALDRTGTAIVRTDTLLKDHEMFNDPRCLDIEDGSLYCLSNIELEPVTFRGEQKPSRLAALDDSYLIRIPLD